MHIRNAHSKSCIVHLVVLCMTEFLMDFAHAVCRSIEVACGSIATVACSFCYSFKQNQFLCLSLPDCSFGTILLNFIQYGKPFRTRCHILKCPLFLIARVEVIQLYTKGVGDSSCNWLLPLNYATVQPSINTIPRI